MEGVLFLVIILLIAVLITPVVIAANSNSKIKLLADELRAIKEYLRSIKKDIEQIPAHPPLAPASPEPVLPETKLVEKTEGPPVIPQEVIPEMIPEPFPAAEVQPVEEIKEEEPTLAMEQPVEPIAGSAAEEQAPALNEEVLAEEAAVYYNAAVTESPAAPALTTPPPYTPPPPQARKKTNFEQFIGEKLISIVGIAILVLGIFFAVKWAIGRNLVSDAGKVMTGLAAGTILVAVAHRLAKNYRAFSSILAGGGIAVFYFSIYEAYQSYHLLSQMAAFIIMVFVTLLAVVLSIIYNKKELAVIAIVGGFCTPFFVSDGSGNYQVLFSYLLILNVGMFALAYFKKWNLVNIICYCFTMLLFSGWVLRAFDVSKGHATGGLVFITLFFLTFFGMNMVYNLKNRARFGFTEISMLLSNSFIYLGFGLYFLSFINNGQYQGMFTLALAAFNFIFAYTFFRKKQVDKNLVYLLIGLVLTFLSLTGPLQLDGNYITLFWASELVILYWMGMKTGISLLKDASILVLGLTLISLGMDWEHDYFNVHVTRLPLVLNKVFITSAVVILAVFIKRFLLKKDTEKTLLRNGLQLKHYLIFTGALMIGLIYISGLLEVQYQSLNITQNFYFQKLMMWMYQYFILAVIVFYFSRKKDQQSSNIVMSFIAFALLLYPVANYAAIDLREHDIDSSLYYWHYLLPVLALSCAGYLINFVRKNYTVEHRLFQMMAWGGTAILLYIISAEAIHIWVTGAHQTGFDRNEIVIRARKVALPIIWSIASLFLMLLGMRKKLRIFRIVSLSLFSLTIAKLFLYDISNVGQGGKIAAFIILGVILLVVSFMYQKIKGLFTDEETVKNDE